MLRRPPTSIKLGIDEIKASLKQHDEETQKAMALEASPMKKEDLDSIIDEVAAAKAATKRAREDRIGVKSNHGDLQVAGRAVQR